MATIGPSGFGPGVGAATGPSQADSAAPADSAGPAAGVPAGPVVPQALTTGFGGPAAASITPAFGEPPPPSASAADLWGAPPEPTPAAMMADASGASAASADPQGAR